MTITPRFELDQSPTHIVIHIRVPHVRVSTESVQIAVIDEDDHQDGAGGSVFHFSSPPYLLVLRFAHLLLQNELSGLDESQEETLGSVATYQPSIENGTITVQLEKAVSAWWPDLDLLGRLTQDRRIPATQSSTKNLPTTSKWLKEVTSVETAPNSAAVPNLTAVHENDTVTTDDKAFLFLESIPNASHCNNVFDCRDGYGFDRMFCGIFTELGRDELAKEMFEGPWQHDSKENCFVTRTPTEIRRIRLSRKQAKRETEAKKFSAERWLQDLFLHDDYIYEMAVTMTPHWTNRSDVLEKVTSHLEQLSIFSAPKDSDTPIHHSFFSSEEQYQLMSIPYPLLPVDDTPDSTTCTLLRLISLLDIMFAYVFDHVTTDGEPTVESAWTINILSSSFSWLEDWLDDTDLENQTDNAIFQSKNEISVKIQSDSRADTDSLETFIGDKLKSVIISSLRRSLIYPYLRNVDFGLFVWKHVVLILQHENNLRCLLRCLLQCRAILHRSELYYLGNKLFVDPYLAWLQQKGGFVLHEPLQTIAQLLDTILDKHCWKDLLDLDLLRIEREAGISAGDNEGDTDASDSDDNGSNDSTSESSNESSHASRVTKETNNSTLGFRESDEVQMPVTLIAASTAIAREKNSTDLQDKQVNTVVSSNLLLDFVQTPTPFINISNDAVIVSEASNEEKSVSEHRPLIEELDGD